MADNMTIGPAMNVGNNQVQMTRKGKVKITNPEGNVITLSKDQFKKQIIKNADLINAGEDVEFQKGGDKKGLKIAGAAVGIAAIATGIVYRKNIAKYMKDFSLKKLGEDIKGLFTKKEKTIKDDKRYSTYSKEQAETDAHKYFLKNQDKINLTDAERETAKEDAKYVFSNSQFKPFDEPEVKPKAKKPKSKKGQPV